MFLTLLWKDIKIQLMTFRFAAAFTTILILVLISFWVLGDDYQRRRNTYNLAAETTNRANQEIYVPSQISPVLHRPPSAMSIFAQGENRRLGNSLQIFRWEVPYKATGSLTDNQLMANEPALDLNTIFAVVVSLFAILFGYDAVSGEREDGTLKLKCTTGVSRASIITSKYLSGTICLIIPVVCSVICGLIMLLTLFSIQFNLAQYTAIGLMVLIGIVYAALFNGIGIACSTFCCRSSNALIFSLLIWAFCSLLIPSIAKNVSRVIKPLASPGELLTTIKVTREEALEKENKFREKYPQYQFGWYGSGFGVLGQGRYLKFDGADLSFRHGEEYVRFADPMMQERADIIWNQISKNIKNKEEQLSFFENINIISPSYQLRRAMTSLANTDFRVYSNFLDSARKYRRRLLDDLASKGYFTSNALAMFTRRPREETSNGTFTDRVRYYQEQLAQGKGYDDFLHPRLWGNLDSNEILPFETLYPEPDIGSALEPFLILSVLSIVVFAVGLISFNRYDVR